MTLSISGTTITLNTEYTFPAAGGGALQTYNMTMMRTLDSTSAICVFYNSSANTYVVGMDVAGTVVTIGTETDLSAKIGTTWNPPWKEDYAQLSILDSTKVIFACGTSLIGSEGGAIVLEKTGTTINDGAFFDYVAPFGTGGFNITVAGLSSTQAIASFQDDLSANYLNYHTVLTISGVTITGHGTHINTQAVSGLDYDQTYKVSDGKVIHIGYDYDGGTDVAKVLVAPTA